MITLLYLLTLAVLVFCTIGILAVADPKKDSEAWWIVFFIILISTSNYWLGVFID